jgi:hypothetical protein
MAIFPRAKTDGLVAIEADGVFVIQDSRGQELARLDRVTALVWRLADGTTAVDQIARTLTSNFDVAADSELVWSALDRLADLSLLTARLTPPVTDMPSSRRTIIRMAVLGGAAAAAGSSLGSKLAQARGLHREPTSTTSNTSNTSNTSTTRTSTTRTPTTRPPRTYNPTLPPPTTSSSSPTTQR